MEAFVYFDMNGDDLIQRYELKTQLPKLGLSFHIDQASITLVCHLLKVAQTMIRVTLLRV